MSQPHPLYLAIKAALSVLDYTHRRKADALRIAAAEHFDMVSGEPRIPLLIGGEGGRTAFDPARYQKDAQYVGPVIGMDFGDKDFTVEGWYHFPSAKGPAVACRPPIVPLGTLEAAQTAVQASESRAWDKARLELRTVLGALDGTPVERIPHPDDDKRLNARGGAKE